MPSSTRLIKLALLLTFATCAYAGNSDTEGGSTKNNLAQNDRAKQEVKMVDMDPENLHSVISNYATNVKINNNVISFEYQRVAIYCVWDAKADRMRMLTPIAKLADLTPELLEMALKANYHTVLDARYAIGDDVLYSAFIHPLSPISQEEIESAIRQVSTAALTFGTSFTSGELVFPGNKSERPQKGQTQSL